MTYVLRYKIKKMMRRKLPLSALTFIIGLPLVSAYGQATEPVAQLVQPVTVKGDVYDQSFSAQKENTCLVRFTAIDAKKGEETVFELNAADLNERAIAFDTKKNEVIVKATTQGKRDLIRVYEDGQVDGYQDELSVLATGIKEARELVAALKDLAGQCQQQTANEEVADQSAASLLSLLEDEVNEVTVNDEAFDQVLAHDAQQPSIITYERTDRNEGETQQFTVNLADLNERSIRFDTKGAAVWVMAETHKKDNLVQMTKNGQPDGYDNEIALLATDIEQARRLEQAWKKLVAMSEGETEFLPNNADPSVTQTLDFLVKHVAPVGADEDKFEQSLSYAENPHNGGGPLLTFRMNDVSKGEESAYAWNMADMHPSSIRFGVQKNQAVVEAQTLDKSDLIAYSEDGVLDGYTDEFTILANSIEEARKLTLALQHLAKKIGDQPASLSLPSTSSALLAFLQERVGDIKVGDEQSSQRIEASDDGACMLEYEIEDANEGDELVYAWNMTDLNENSITLGTKGNAVFVSLQTIGKRDLIEVIENGEVDDYEKDFSLRAAGIEEAREIIAALKQLIQLCKEK